MHPIFFLFYLFFQMKLYWLCLSPFPIPYKFEIWVRQNSQRTLISHCHFAPKLNPFSDLSVPFFNNFIFPIIVPITSRHSFPCFLLRILHILIKIILFLKINNEIEFTPLQSKTSFPFSRKFLEIWNLVPHSLQYIVYSEKVMTIFRSQPFSQIPWE